MPVNAWPDVYCELTVSATGACADAPGMPAAIAGKTRMVAIIATRPMLARAVVPFMYSSG
jgi:hypothetical protein